VNVSGLRTFIRVEVKSEALDSQNSRHVMFRLRHNDTRRHATIQLRLYTTFQHNFYHREDGRPPHSDQYVELLAGKKVPEKARRWYVEPVEFFLRQVNPKSLDALEAVFQ